MIKETGYIYYSTIAPGKLIKEGYKLFTISDKGYLYNYTWYSPIQGLKDKPKIKGLRDTSAIVFELATNTLPHNSILFINNYFTEPKLAIALKDRGITIYKTIKSNRLDLSKLLIKMK